MATQPDDLCPHCGVPVPRGRQSDACPYCHEPFEAAEANARSRGHLTPFGHGVCGLIIGGEIGAAAALADPGIRLEDPRLTLFPLAGALACAAFAAGLGSRLDAGARAGFEIALFACLCGALVSAVAALMGVESAETLVCIGAVVALLAALVLRRHLHAPTLAGTIGASRK